MSLEGDCNEVEVTSYLELLVTFGMRLEGVCHDLWGQIFSHKIWVWNEFGMSLEGDCNEVGGSCSWDLYMISLQPHI